MSLPRVAVVRSIRVSAAGRLHASCVLPESGRTTLGTDDGASVRPQLPGQISVCSEISSASSTSIPSYLTVLSSLV